MQSSRSFLLQVCLSLLLSTGSCTCKPLSDNDIQGREPEELHSKLSEEELLEEEEDNEARVENLLGTMKEGFLRKLNLSDVPQEHGKIDPPQFMMELYDKYASDSSAIPQSDVIRSFTVQGKSARSLLLRLTSSFSCVLKLYKYHNISWIFFLPTLLGMNSIYSFYLLSGRKRDLKKFERSVKRQLVCC